MWLTNYLWSVDDFDSDDDNDDDDNGDGNNGNGNDDNGNDEKWIIIWLHYKVSKN